MIPPTLPRLPVALLTVLGGVFLTRRLGLGKVMGECGQDDSEAERDERFGLN